MTPPASAADPPRTMIPIGFQHNYSMHTDLSRRFSPSLVNRVALIEREIRPAGYRLFLYNPQAVDLATGRAQGFEFDEGRFSPVEAEIPRVNGNWTHRTRRLLDQGVGYERFLQWALAEGIGIYVPNSLSELFGNKLETYKLVRSFHETLHPHCESYRHRRDQLQTFVDSSPIVFVKPRTGSKGDGIVTLRRSPAGLSLTRYEKGERLQRHGADLDDAMDFLATATAGGQMFIIQHGIETLRYEGSAFDIRVTMLNDGESWHWLNEARVSRGGSDVSNVAQGGAICVTEELLYELLGAERSRELLYHLKSESFGLANYIEALHPGEVPELAFDFAVQQDGQLRLLEINTKPGLAGIGANINVYEMRPEHEAAFERWVYPHTRYLAQFLLAKARQRSA